MFLRVQWVCWRFLCKQNFSRSGPQCTVARRSYTEKLKSRFSANEPASVSRGLQDITNYRKLTQTFTRRTHSGSDITPPTSTPATPSTLHWPPTCTVICEVDVCQLIHTQKIRKASASCLKACIDQLTIFTQIIGAHTSEEGKRKWNAIMKETGTILNDSINPSPRIKDREKVVFICLILTAHWPTKQFPKYKINLCCAKQIEWKKKLNMVVKIGVKGTVHPKLKTAFSRSHLQCYCFGVSCRALEASAVEMPPPPLSLVWHC